MKLVAAFLLLCLCTACASNRPTKAGLYKHNRIPEFVKEK